MNKPTPTSTVGRSRTVPKTDQPAKDEWVDELGAVYFGDSLDFYDIWETPTTIISDGGYGVLGFDGDTAGHETLPQWYEKHIAEWSRLATAGTTLWFWNSEIGWASVHPILEKYGWKYVSANIWDKGKGHIAGNVNTKRIRQFPVVSEMCVQYVFEETIDGLKLKQWLLQEWKRTGLPLKRANEACGVKDAAVRKYLDQGHLWYFPPPETFQKLQEYANKYGREDGRPYFSKDGIRPMEATDWERMRSKFRCPHGYTNVWHRPALRASERLKTNGNKGKSVHLNQKPLDLMSLIIEASSDPRDVVWEPFGGLFSAVIAARKLGRKAYGAEIDSTYFNYGVNRLLQEESQHLLL